jgi:hypothetical protein
MSYGWEPTLARLIQLVREHVRNEEDEYSPIAAGHRNLGRSTRLELFGVPISLLGHVDLRDAISSLAVHQIG